MRRGLSAVGAAALGGALIASGGPAWAATTVTSNAFAVGSVTAASGGAKSAVAVRWNGSAWSQLAVPKPAGTDTEFTAVKAFSATDVWAVGDTAPAGSTFRQTLTMHDNGATWSTSATPSPGTRNNTVTAVDGVSGTDAWAVGYTLDLPYGNRIRDSLILHWNGTAWTQVPSPNNGSTYLYDVAAVSANEAWAVGYGSTAGAFVLLERYRLERGRGAGTVQPQRGGRPVGYRRVGDGRRRGGRARAGPLERHRLVGHAGVGHRRSGNAGAHHGRGCRPDHRMGGGLPTGRDHRAGLGDRVPGSRLTAGIRLRSPPLGRSRSRRAPFTLHRAPFTRNASSRQPARLPHRGRRAGAGAGRGGAPRPTRAAPPPPPPAGRRR